MNITEHEMRGLLAGKCLPGDMRFNEELPAYLVRKFAEAKAERDALAAENAALSRYFSDSAGAVGNWNSWADPEDKLASAPETPATDAYLNSVRAEGVEALADKFAAIGSLATGHIANEMRAFSAQIRAGEPS